MRKNRFYSIFILSSMCIFILSASTNYNSTGVSQKTDHVLSGTDTTVQAPWKAPASANSLKSPFAFTSETEQQGAELYNVYCWSCHGDTGYGDGAAGGALGVKPANFHDELVIKQSDGALFWKMTIGRGNMPPFKEILSEEQRWQLVSYLRKLPKEQ